MGQATARGLTARPHSEQTGETPSGYPQATQRPDLTRSQATATLKIAPRVSKASIPPAVFWEAQFAAGTLPGLLREVGSGAGHPCPAPFGPDMLRPSRG